MKYKPSDALLGEQSGLKPLRMCVICRKRLPKKELLRMVRRIKGSGTAIIPTDGTPCLVEDYDQTASGRGWYICREPRCKEKLGGFQPGGKKAWRVKHYG